MVALKAAGPGHEALIPLSESVGSFATLSAFVSRVCGYLTIDYAFSISFLTLGVSESP